jgi:hypothetical protein
MRIVMRGTMAHILLQDDREITDIIQDIVLQPPEKYYVEINLDKNNEIVSLILTDSGNSIEKMVRILELFANKYKNIGEANIEEGKYTSISHVLLEIINSLRKTNPLYPRNLFWYDSE